MATTSNAGVNVILGEPGGGQDDLTSASSANRKFVISHHGPVGTTQQSKTAAAFFARKNGTKTSSPIHYPSEAKTHTISDYGTVLGQAPPTVPSSLLKKMEVTEVQGLGKVRVVLRVAASAGNTPCFQMDKKKKQVTLYDPSTHRNDDQEGRISAPKMFAFDGLFTDEDPQADVCSSALTDTIHSVVNGTDGCLFCFGHESLGKTYTMIGSDESSKTLGVIPTAVSWLYRCIKEKKDKTGTKFAVRVSAAEIGGSREELRDLLAAVKGPHSDQDPTGAPPPSAFIPNTANLLQNLTELRSPTVEKAGQFLDAALTARSTNMAADVSGKDSHFIYTLHVYQYAATSDKSGQVIGGRSRLHLIDFGGCERTKKGPGSGITLSGLGNVILAIFNGQRHLPCKESRVTQLLKECLGSLACQATMLAHVSPEPSHYSETLHTTQLASRIHRMRRKKAKSTGGSGGGSGSGSSDEKTTKLVKLIPGGSVSSELTTSTDPSSSEQSCDTVIYVGSRDDEGTDAEHPPVYIPNLNSGDTRGVMAHVLRGSTAELPTSKKSTLERKRPSKSPASSLSNHKVLTATRTRPGSCGSTPTHRNRLSATSGGKCPVVNAQNPNTYYNMGRGSLPRNPKGKMPLHGRVAGYRQQPVNHQYWFDQQQFFQKCMVPSPNHHSPCADYPLTMEQQAAIYGYMDDHKKNMIQQWVECQARINTCPGSPMRVPPSHCQYPLQFVPNLMTVKKPEPEPFAWLNDPDLADENGCKALTQFKTAESSEDSFSDEYSKPQLKKAPSTSSGTISITADVHIHPTSLERRASSVDRKRTNRKSQLTGSKVHSRPTTHEEKKSSVQRPSAVSVEEVKTQKKAVEERRDNAEQTILTNENTTVERGNNGVKDRSNIKDSKEDDEVDCPKPKSCDNAVKLEEENASSLDELYNHCEQLVETLSQASEDLRQMQNEDYIKKAFQRKTPQKETASDENLCPPDSFDGNSLHYAEKGLNCDSISVDGGEEQLDQLAKLHQLYQSVSSISAKSQINLQRQQEQQGSQRSLTALFHDLERISLKSDSEVNSLCSEPVKMYDYNDFNGMDNQNFATVSMADIFGDICGHQGELKVNLNDESKDCCKSTVSLCDLATESQPGKLNGFSSALNVNERSDSPILEVLDQELAKYAKLKDLKQVYTPKVPQKEPRDLSSATAMLRHPDGASNPDLKSPQDQNCVPAARRSPGNGRSGSEPDDVPFEELPPLPPCQKPSKPVPIHASMSSSSSISTSCSNASNRINNNNAGYAGIQRNGLKLSSKNRFNNNTDCDTTSSELEVWQVAPKPVQAPNLNENQLQSTTNNNKQSSQNENPKSSKGPRFSRLFKLSRSPLKIVKVNEDKKRSKSLENNQRNKANKANKAKKESKNGAGTSSRSEPSNKTLSRRQSHQQHPKAMQIKPGDASSAGSGYESGHETSAVASKRASSFIKTCAFVKLRPNGGQARRGAKQSSDNKKRVRASHCKSSGYESSNGDRDSLEDDVVTTSILKYDQSFIDRLDKRWRFDEVRRLRHSQATLKRELKDAKDRIHAESWSFELHVEESLNGSPAAIQETDPTFVEALAKETSILKKRVDACKNHAVLQTCFDFKPQEGKEDGSSMSPDTRKLYDNCCTTSCESAQDMIIPSSNETEIF